MASIEGNAVTTSRPPFPTRRDCGKATVLNNVETFANISVIIEKAVNGLPRTVLRRAKALKFLHWLVLSLIQGYLKCQLEPPWAFDI
jgi:NADH:ubiquinone oxidoreductase subunit F (NADH-binding)